MNNQLNEQLQEIKNKKCYHLIAKSNGRQVILRKEVGGITRRYITEIKEEYKVPYFFNTFYKRTERVVKAGMVLQSLSYIGISTKITGYVGICNFKPCKI